MFVIGDFSFVLKWCWVVYSLGFWRVDFIPLRGIGVVARLVWKNHSESKSHYRLDDRVMVKDVYIGTSLHLGLIGLPMTVGDSSDTFVCDEGLQLMNIVQVVSGNETLYNGYRPINSRKSTVSRGTYVVAIMSICTACTLQAISRPAMQNWCELKRHQRLLTFRASSMKAWIREKCMSLQDLG